MCWECYREYGGPTEVTQKSLDVQPLITQVYQHNMVGGALHIVLDDWNLEECHVAWCLEEARAGHYVDSEQERLDTIACAEALLDMTEEERAVALAIYDGFLLV